MFTLRIQLILARWKILMNQNNNSIYLSFWNKTLKNYLKAKERKKQFWLHRLYTNIIVITSIIIIIIITTSSSSE